VCLPLSASPTQANDRPVFLDVTIVSLQERRFSFSLLFSKAWLSRARALREVDAAGPGRLVEAARQVDALGEPLRAARVPESDGVGPKVLTATTTTKQR
jgi:hypothetical protein